MAKSPNTRTFAAPVEDRPAMRLLIALEQAGENVRPLDSILEASKHEGYFAIVSHEGAERSVKLKDGGFVLLNPERQVTAEAVIALIEA